MTTYLGISSAHDSSVCFYKNGNIDFFLKEERVVGRKREKDGILSLYSFDTKDDIVYSLSSPSQNKAAYEFTEYLVSKKFKISKSYDYSGEHHLIHANLAFYDSGFDKALVFVVDRNGSFIEINGIFNESCREAESVYIAEYPNIFTPIYKNYWINDHTAYESIKLLSKQHPSCNFSAKSMYSIVKVYETATSLILQDILENGKTMGLSAYGNKKIEFPKLFMNDSIPVDSFFGHEIIDNQFYAVNTSIQKFAKKDINLDNYQPYADYAWQVQKQTQEALASLVDKYITETGINNVCITGGYGLNVVANHYLITQFPNVNFFFEPLADDSGNSIGASMKSYRDETFDIKKYPLRHTFFNGKRHKPDNSIGTNVSIADVAKLISEGKSVAVYQGLAEAGPRALGNRSILFDPRDINAKEKVNKIKKREWYRPFAGMVLESDANIYFEMGRLNKSEFMTISFPVKDIAIDKIPGIIHVDNTCRIQTVSEDNLNIFELIKEFKKITGIGVILNTSFNLAGKPLVETPEDAVDTLLSSDLDYVWFPEIQKIISNKDLI